MTSLGLIAFIAAPIALLLLEKPFGLVTKAVDRLDRIWILRKGLSVYNFASFWVMVGLWAFMLMYAPQVFAENKNPVVAFYLDGHWLSWLALLAVVTRFGYFNIVRGAYAGAFVYCAHELTWITFAGIYNGAMVMIYLHFAPALVVMVSLVLGYFLAYRGLPLRKEVLVVLIIMVWDVLWMFAGFHAAVNNWLPNPKTAYFYDPIVNLVEVLGWVIPSLVALL
jgi:hypothetical protein